MPSRHSSRGPVSQSQSTTQLGHVAPGNGDRLAVGEGEVGRPAQLRAQLDRLVQVGHVLAVDPHDPNGRHRRSTSASVARRR